MPAIHHSNCPVCQSPGLQTIFAVKDFTVSDTFFDVAECPQCSLRITQDVPPVDEIGAYYQSENYISHTDTAKGFVNALYQKVRKRTLQQKAGIIKKFTGQQEGRLLDIGCGTGAFLDVMQQAQWTVTGIEPDAGARHIAKEKYGIEALSPVELYKLPAHQFDAITMWHVLEHVHDLNSYMTQLFTLLQPTGKLFIAVPNYTSKDAATYKQYWAAYDVPRHLYHFSPKSMKHLLAKHGFELVKMLPMWYDSFYVSLLSSKYKNGQTQFVSAALHGLASNINAVNNAEACSSVIYVVRKGIMNSQ